MKQPAPSITKRPALKDKAKEVIQDPEEIEKRAAQFIQGAASVVRPDQPVGAEETEVEEKLKNYPVRMHPDDVKEIEDLLKLIPKRNRPSRNQWMVAAIKEKLARDIKKLTKPKNR
jgi:hypothetical protein